MAETIDYDRRRPPARWPRRAAVGLALVVALAAAVPFGRRLYQNYVLWDAQRALLASVRPGRPVAPAPAAAGPLLAHLGVGRRPPVQWAGLLPAADGNELLVIVQIELASAPADDPPRYAIDWTTMVAEPAGLLGPPRGLMHGSRRHGGLGTATAATVGRTGSVPGTIRLPLILDNRTIEAELFVDGTTPTIDLAPPTPTPTPGPGPGPGRRR